MDFQPTEERRMLADMIGKFIQNDYPLKERLTAGASALGYCPAAYRTMAQLGLIGALFEEEVGGFGGSGFDIAPSSQSWAKVWYLNRLMIQH